MPKLEGFELLEVLQQKPEIIFTTAYDQFAIRAFEMNAVDYLLKPFSKERFDSAVNQSIATIGQEKPPQEDPIGKLQQHLDTNQGVLERIVTPLGSRVTVIQVDRSGIWKPRMIM
jgi:two-component system LytT family response regulator